MLVAVKPLFARNHFGVFVFARVIKWIVSLEKQRYDPRNHTKENEKQIHEKGSS